jgi:hypothetical protein
MRGRRSGRRDRRSGGRPWRRYTVTGTGDQRVDHHDEHRQGRAEHNAEEGHGFWRNPLQCTRLRSIRAGVASLAFRHRFRLKGLVPDLPHRITELVTRDHSHISFFCGFPSVRCHAGIGHQDGLTPGVPASSDRACYLVDRPGAYRALAPLALHGYVVVVLVGREDPRRGGSCGFSPKSRHRRSKRSRPKLFPHPSEGNGKSWTRFRSFSCTPEASTGQRKEAPPTRRVPLARIAAALCARLTAS